MFFIERTVRIRKSKSGENEMNSLLTMPIVLYNTGVVLQNDVHANVWLGITGVHWKMGI